MTNESTKLEAFNSGTFKEQYHESFSPNPINRTWTWDNANVSTLQRSLWVSLGLKMKTPVSNRGIFRGPRRSAWTQRRSQFLNGLIIFLICYQPNINLKTKSPGEVQRFLPTGISPNPNTKIYAEDDKHQVLSTSGSLSSKWKDETDSKIQYQ
jgi:hypothetical protein